MSEAPILELPLGEVRAVRERPADRPPPPGTVVEVMTWLLNASRDYDNAVEVYEEFCWRLVGAGLPVARATLHVDTLHPQFFGYTLRWWRDRRRTEYLMAKHELRDTSAFRDSAVAQCFSEGGTIRRRLAGDDSPRDFPILESLRSEGVTDYLVVPIRGGRDRRHVGTFATDRAGGFTDAEIDELLRLSDMLGVLIDHFNVEQTARNVIGAYVGHRAGPRVLAGQIQRGSGEQMHAVVWSSDIRGFTQCAERLPGERVIAILNACFDAQATAIAAEGGEILKFIGDGLLAIFPVGDDETARAAARAALAAARQALDAIATLSGSELCAGEPPLRVVVALHIGDVFYGNIGAADRLDFTVIGPAVNITSRAAELGKALDLDLIVSDSVAALAGAGLRSLGPQQLRGLEGTRELFTWVEAADATVR